MLICELFVYLDGFSKLFIMIMNICEPLSVVACGNGCSIKIEIINK